MGISGLYGQWLKYKNYPGVITQNAPRYVSSFCFDFNGLIHKVAGIVYGYSPDTKPERVEYVRKTSSAELEREFFAQITSSLMNIISQYKPQDIVILAVDGVAPQAKIKQQRQRRYKAAMAKTSDAVFDSNSITPGTDMMRRLDAYMTDWIKKEGYTHNMPKMVIYSGHMCSGEGEHKIMDYIRRGVLKGDGAHLIYGLDADLIMLSMLAPMERIYLMREDSRDMIDIDNLKDYILEEMGTPTGIQDFVFMMSMVGNDFLPAIPSLKTKRESIDEMVNAYKLNGEQITKDDVINWSAFMNVLKLLVKNEENMLIDLSKVETKHPILAFNNAFGKNGKFDLNVFKNDWYRTHLAPRGDSKYIDVVTKITKKSLMPDIKTSVEKIVKSYLTGIAWVYTYYKTGQINYSYVYDFFFAPLIVDLVNSVIPEEKDYIYDPDIKMYHPFYQLLSVIPPASSDVLISELRALYKINSPITDMLPNKVDVDLQGATLDNEGNTKEWEGVVIVPAIDISRIISTVRDIDISYRKCSMFEPKENIITEKPIELQIAEREQRMLLKSVHQEKKFKHGKHSKEWNPNGWAAAHLLY